MRWTSAAFLVVWVGAVGALPSLAGEVRFLSQGSAEDFVAGTLDGTTVDALGSLRLGREVERVAGIEEPFVLCAAPHPEGWVVGTGNSGRVLLVGRDGTVRTLLEAAEPEVFAVHVDPDGTVFAGTSPGGRVYRILPTGEPETFFEPGERYIWAMDRTSGGALLVATGTEGHLWSVDQAGGGTLLLDSEETHLRTMVNDEDGSVLLGTSGAGLILRLDPSGRVRTLFDAKQPEVVAFARGEGGAIWAALVASEATLAPQEEGAGGDSTETGSAAVTVEGGDGIEKPGPRSEIVRITPDGAVQSLWRFAEETVYDLAVADGRLWVATGLEGQLFSWRDDAMLIEQDVDERQIVALVAGEAGVAFATTNAGALYRTLEAPRSSGTFVSAPLDAGAGSRFGLLRWIGEAPEGTSVGFRARSGMSATPDRTWGEWQAIERGREASLAAVPLGRYLQWEAELGSAEGVSPVIAGVETSYRQSNLPPRIESFQVLDPGQVLVAATFNPNDQIYEPAHPNRQGIFNSLEASAERDAGRLKTLWRHGYRTLRWEAEDPNEDELQAALAFRPEGSETWLPMEEELTDPYYSFDATVLADGVYRFRLSVDDGADNPGEAVTVERVSPPVVVDHSPPVVVTTRARENALEVTVEDALGPLREASVSWDGAEWEPAEPVDGLLDGRHEVLRLPLRPAGLVLLRLMDASFNVRTVDLSEGRP
jgi:outer membrane protein assembly factor BamB